MSRPMTTESDRPMRLASMSMIRMFAWCGRNTSMSSGWRPAASMAAVAALAISKLAHLKTVGPFWRRVGHEVSVPSFTLSQEWVMFTASACEPSDPHTVGPIPGVSDGPMTAAPAPSPRRKEIERSVGSMTSDMRSAPTTRT